jgi:hypothetical protein
MINENADCTEAALHVLFTNGIDQRHVDEKCDVFAKKQLLEFDIVGVCLMLGQRVVVLGSELVDGGAVD